MDEYHRRAVSLERTVPHRVFNPSSGTLRANPKSANKMLVLSSLLFKRRFSGFKSAGWRRAVVPVRRLVVEDFFEFFGVVYATHHLHTSMRNLSFVQDFHCFDQLHRQITRILFVIGCHVSQSFKDIPCVFTSTKQYDDDVRDQSVNLDESKNVGSPPSAKTCTT